MAVIAKTKRELRAQLFGALLDRDEYIVRTPSSVSASAITYSALASLFPSSHFVGGEIRGTVSSTDETVRIASTTPSGLTLTPTSNFSNSPTSATVQVVRAAYSFVTFDGYLERALWQLSLAGGIPKTDDSLMTEAGRSLYRLPSWTELFEVWIDDQAKGNDHYAPAASEYAGETAIDAVAEELSQGIKPLTEWYVDAVWLLLRAVGDPSGNLAVNIRSNASGVPTGGAGGLLGTSSNVAMATALYDQYGWVRFGFSSPVRLSANTVYHICLNPDSSATMDSTNYVAWKHSTLAGYTDGAPASSTDSGGNWTAASGLDRCFRVMDVRSERWRKLGWNDWRVVPATTRQLWLSALYDSVPRPLRLIGQGAPAELTTDSTTCEANPEAVIAMAQAMAIEQGAGGDRGQLQQAAYFRDRAETIWARTDVLRPRRLIETH